MTLTQLRAFLEALTYGSFTAAARALDISQASVSELINRLEEELDVKLFVRQTRGLTPTSQAELLAPFAEKILATTEQARTTLGAVQRLETGSVHFGVPRNARFYGLDEFALRFHSDFPGIQLRLIGVNSAHVAADIAKGDLEAGLVVLPISTEGLTFDPIAKDDVLLAVPPGSTITTATLETLSEQSLVLYDAHAGAQDPTRKQVAELCQEQGITLNPVIEVEQVEIALKLVEKGTGITLVSASLVRSGQVPEGVRVVPFSPPITETLAIAYRQGRNLSPATMEMVRQVKQAVWDSFE